MKPARYSGGDALVIAAIVVIMAAWVMLIWELATW